MKLKEKEKTIWIQRFFFLQLYTSQLPIQGVYIYAGFGEGGFYIDVGKAHT